MFRSLRSPLLCLVMVAGACSDDDDNTEGSGSVSISLDAEATIIDGIEAGDDIEEIADGWRVDFDKYIVAIGNIELELATDETSAAHADDVYLVDLATLDYQGLPLWELEDLAAAEWQIHYSTVGAGDGAVERHQSVSEADLAAMVDADATYLLAGTIQQTDGLSCPPASLAEPGDLSSTETRLGDPCYSNPNVSFSWLLPAEIEFGPCELDGMEGFSIPEGGSTNIAITIHGDHIFFNGFPTGSEGGVTRLAQWLADCDLNLDGTVTQEELEQIAPSDLHELDSRYQLSSPFDELPLDTMWDYVRAQLMTQGHFQGEGECDFGGEHHEH